MLQFKRSLAYPSIFHMLSIIFCYTSILVTRWVAIKLVTRNELYGIEQRQISEQREEEQIRNYKVYNRFVLCNRLTFTH